MSRAMRLGLRATQTPPRRFTVDDDVRDFKEVENPYAFLGAFPRTIC